MDHGLLGAPEKAETSLLILYKDDSGKATMISIHTAACAYIGEFFLLSQMVEVGRNDYKCGLEGPRRSTSKEVHRGS